MKVLGIDVGTAITGWSILEKKSQIVKVIGYGVITTNKNLEMSERLLILFNELNEIISTFKPDDMAVEELFFFKNSKTVITVGQARGVILLAGVINKLNVVGYTPLQVKQAVTGYGRADKIQIQKMVKIILKLDNIPKPDDAADALAIAICHFNSVNLRKK
ncbi:crossover junction endodeoxyribonuclease RuvC [Candidatus Dojkabacteria bacterium]|nr:crossover junction endodeoxyribonuclease RuvC [Candidatus Dojkabacteria bacterium]